MKNHIDKARSFAITGEGGRVGAGAFQLLEYHIIGEEGGYG